MNSKTLLIIGALGALAAAAWFFMKKGNPGVGSTGQRHLGAPPPPPPPAARPVTPVASTPSWMSELSAGAGIVKDLTSIWGNLGWGEDDEEGFVGDS